MRRSSIVLVSAAIAVLGSSVSQASVSTSTAAQQAFFTSGSVSTMTGSITYWLNLYNEVGASSLGQVVTPGTRFEAAGWVAVCDLVWNCSYQNFATQTVSPTAFSMDPAGNSGTFRACLLPSSGPCKAFDITMTRPNFTQPSCGTLCVYPNAWFDPTTGTAGGNVFAFAGVYRQGYTVSGVLGGTPPIVTSGGMQTYSFNIAENSTAD